MQRAGRAACSERAVQRAAACRTCSVQAVQRAAACSVQRAGRANGWMDGEGRPREDAGKTPPRYTFPFPRVEKISDSMSRPLRGSEV